jgi:hypothetical protein
MLPAGIEPLSLQSTPHTDRALTTELSAPSCVGLIFSIQVHGIIYLFDPGISIVPLFWDT